MFVGTNTIIASTDGGVYQVVNPRGGNNPPTWSSINGNLVITEMYQADVDNRNTATTADDVYMAAAQDNGQSEAVFGQTWNEVETGDGTVVRADDVNRYRYYSAQSFLLTRRNPDNTLVRPAGAINGGGSLIGTTPFLPVMTLNQADTNLMLVGGPFQDLYLSGDHADTFQSIGGVAGSPVTNVTSTVTAIAFGTTTIRFAAYVATDDGNISQSFDVTSGGGNFRVTNFSTVAGGEAAFGVVMDPNNPLIAYAITPTRVFRTVDGLNWSDITGTLATSFSSAGLTKVGSLALFTNGTVTSADDVLLVGGYGGVFANRVGQTPDPTAVGPWLKFGDAFPNVVVSDLRYDAVGDTVVAATYGRGGFRLTQASQALNNPAVITVTGNAAANNMAVYPDPTDATRFVVTDGLGNTQTFNLNAIRNVVFNGLGGADTVTVGAPTPGQAGTTFPLGLVITVNGGGDAGDTLVVQNAADTGNRQVTVTASSVGGGFGDNLFSSAGSLSFSGLNNGSVQLLLGSGADTLRFDDTATATAVNYTVTGTRVTRSLGGTFDYSGADQMALLAGPGASTIDLQSLSVPLTVDGGAGSDTVRLTGTAGDESVTVQMTTPTGGGTIGGFFQPVGYAGLEGVAFDGGGGVNSLSIQDASETVYGSPTNPAAGIVFRPTGPTSGAVTVGSAMQFPVTSLTGTLAVDGDVNGNGDRDTLLVLGTSASGSQSAFGETVSGDGRDQVTVSDFQVSQQSLTGSPYLSVSMNPTSLNTVYVFTGNEAGTLGDRITVNPSGLVNLVVDGGAPTSRPGDQIQISGQGPFSVVPVDDPSLGPPQNRVTSADGTSVGLIGIEQTSLTGANVNGMIAAASDTGPETAVEVYDRLTGAFRYRVVPFPGFTGGASVASGDINGDGIADLLVGAGPGGGPRVAIFNGVDGGLMADFFGYEAEFRGGVNVSAADINRDGFTDIILGTGPGGGPRVRILSGRDFSVLRDVFAYDFRFRGGVNVAAGDVNGDGTPDLVTSTGSGGGPQVVVLNGTDLRQIASFFVFDPTSRAGFYATAGDVDGDGFADIIVGAGAGEPARVRVFSGLTRQVTSDFIVNDPVEPGFGIPSIPFDAGVRVAAADANGDGIDDIVTAKGPGSMSTLRIYQVGAVNPQTNALEHVLAEIRRQDVLASEFGFGVFVGASN